MAFSVTVNRKDIPVVWYGYNPLTEEACREKGLEYVDNNVIHTYHLQNIGPGIITPEIYGCIFYAPERFDLTQPIISPIAVSLPKAQSALVEVVAFSYQERAGFDPYVPIANSCMCRADMSCGEVMNLGFLLIKNNLSINTTRLGILAIYDRDYVRVKASNVLPKKGGGVMGKKESKTITVVLQSNVASKLDEAYLLANVRFGLPQIDKILEKHACKSIRPLISAEQRNLVSPITRLGRTFVLIFK